MPSIAIVDTGIQSRNDFTGSGPGAQKHHGQGLRAQPAHPATSLRSAVCCPAVRRSAYWLVFMRLAL